MIHKYFYLVELNLFEDFTEMLEICCVISACQDVLKKLIGCTVASRLQKEETKPSAVFV